MTAYKPLLNLSLCYPADVSLLSCKHWTCAFVIIICYCRFATQLVNRTYISYMRAHKASVSSVSGSDSQLSLFQRLSHIVLFPSGGAASVQNVWRLLLRSTPLTSQLQYSPPELLQKNGQYFFIFSLDYHVSLQLEKVCGFPAFISPVLQNCTSPRSELLSE